MRGLLGKALRRLQAGGPAAILEALADRAEDWRDARFDRRFGIDTRFEPGHQPIQIGVFDRIVRAVPAAPRELAFVDYGCGKGRALVLAAEHGFAHVAGIEHVPALHAQARRNVESYRERRPAAPSIEVRLGDAAEFEAPEGRALLFFYNPFDEAVMARVLAQLEARWIERPAPWFLAYRTARHARLMNDARWLDVVIEHPAFSIWRTRVLQTRVGTARPP